jgi:hypothetical protein
VQCVEQYFYWLGNSARSFNRCVFTALLGLLLLAVGIRLLWWNTGQEAHIGQAMIEMGKELVMASSDHVDPSLNGNPVCLAGEARGEAPPQDAQFGIMVPKQIQLHRTVEMYQRQEQRQHDSHAQMGNGTQRSQPIYTYTQGRSSSPANNMHLQDSIHVNPRFPISSETFEASNITIGRYHLADNLLGTSDDYTHVNLRDDTPAPNRYRVFMGTFTTSQSPKTLYIGDLRVSFEAIPEGSVSLTS